MNSVATIRREREEAKMFEKLLLLHHLEKYDQRMSFRKCEGVSCSVTNRATFFI